MEKTKVLKGLTKEVIKASKLKQLCFTKENLKNIKDSAKVTLTKYNDFWRLEIYTKYDNYDTGSYWKGSVTFYPEKREGKMYIYSGFASNPIGRVDDIYKCSRPNGTDYKIEFSTILNFIIQARMSSLGMDKAYSNFVKETGCLD